MKLKQVEELKIMMSNFLIFHNNLSDLLGSNWYSKEKSLILGISINDKFLGTSIEKHSYHKNKNRKLN